MNFLEIQFALRGKTLPADHGYALYSALKNIVSEESKKKDLNNTDIQNFPPEVILSSIPGVPDRKGLIYLNRSSRLRLRCPSEQAQQWYRLFQNQVLDIRGNLIRLVQPRLCLLEPSEILKARLVTFKFEKWDIHEAPVYFLESCKKALLRLEISGKAFIDSNSDGDLAVRSLRIKQKNVMGFGVVVENLNEEDSIKLQCYGLGGRKHFGCGWFYPCSEVQA
ncbi:CRISPR-associated protein, Cas6-related protein [Hyella patelloides LEGE 07179]|uniref:CRISPR-associated protein, Cas6-related protein n=1 Tax=Hyella patelloides LEGE 07179 TaxID=945734 RepID=A0A563VZX8_9CYAN|nr:type I-MYXAN CRISPR-associated protein Cas6/Cmx6 [Hyella patelloides]VEP17004.1 CRISPR-associated protein, Cas6-related protein [Hyella patelloides LEGE 07179]